MMMSLYFTLGIFLLVAVRNPSVHRSLIAFAAWSANGRERYVVKGRTPRSRGLIRAMAASGAGSTPQAVHPLISLRL